MHRCIASPIKTTDTTITQQCTNTHPPLTTMQALFTRGLGAEVRFTQGTQMQPEGPAYLW
eukprot:scaffold549756_cov20-Prasinocladus_malaysianus.AAC.2